LVTMLGGPALAQRSGEISAGQAWHDANPELRRRVRLNRGFLNLVGQQPNVQAACGPAGASHVRARSNGFDALFGILTVGLYTPQHAQIVCNPPRAI